MSEAINPLFTFPKKRNYVEMPDKAPVDPFMQKQNQRRAGNDDFMAMLAKAFEQMMGGQGRETTAQKLGALRNDPIGDSNKQKYLDATSVNNQFIPGYGSSLGPMTAASGMTPEQVARMQGPTAANQWKFPELFKAPRVFPDKPQGGGWQMPNVGLKQSIFDGTAPFQTPKLSPQGQSPMEGFNPETAPAPKPQVNPMEGFEPETAPAPNPMFAFNPESAQGPSPMLGFNPQEAPAPPPLSYTVGQGGQKFSRNGKPTYGPQFEDIMKFFGVTK